MISPESYVPSSQQIEAVLAYLPVITMPGFVASTLRAPPGQLPYHQYSGELLSLEQALYENGLVVAFDWMSWQNEADRYLQFPALLQSADLKTLRRLITTHVRADRFVDGHLAAVVTSGHFLLLLERLRDLHRG